MPLPRLVLVLGARATLQRSLSQRRSSSSQGLIAFADGEELHGCGQFDSCSAGRLGLVVVATAAAEETHDGAVLAVEYHVAAVGAVAYVKIVRHVVEHLGRGRGGE